MAGRLGPLDWAQPWFVPWRGPGEPVLAALAQGLALHDALDRQPPGVMRFVPHQALPPGEPYESFIFRSGQCPTRENLHDFFNGLCWLQLPAAKGQLNRLQADAIAAAPPGAARGPLRDAITVFDENGALLEAPPALWDALQARDWKRLFIDLRALWKDARVMVFGHALLEKLARPRKALTAHVWQAPCPLEELGATDRWLAAQFSLDRLAAKPFLPLPVLGIPGWWPGNENFSFYDDSVVFRRRPVPPSPACRSPQGPTALPRT